jgi:hypothetical protein
MMSQSHEPRLLDRVRTAIRVRHYSRRTENAYVGGIRRFILHYGKRHPPVRQQRTGRDGLSGSAAVGPRGEDPGRRGAS